MAQADVSRRTLLKGGGALTGLSVLRVAASTEAMGQTRGEVIQWLDQPPPNPFPEITGKLLKWEALDTWLTAPRDFFYAMHYGIPNDLNDATWRVDISGSVARPLSLSLEDLKARPRHEVNFTLECSGNNGIGLDFFIGAVGNATWAGAQLAPLLERAIVLDGASEVVFWGADKGTVAIRDNSGIVGAGQTGQEQPDNEGGLDLTITEQFARSMSLSDALNRDNLLCYEMNGEALPPENGFPLRLIAPGWYGIANVKWLKRIEVLDHRFVGRFMARDYVSIREEQRGGQTVWTFATVGRSRLKSAPAKVTRGNDGYSIMGAAWGAPIAKVEVQIDGGPWMAAKLDDRLPGRRTYSWRFWTFNWGRPVSGEHRIRSRAYDVEGNVQPAPEDPFLTSRRTYWESNGQITRRVMIS